MFHLKVGDSPWVIYPHGERGALLPDEKQMHINVLELKAVLLSRKSFVKTSYKHIKIMSENTTAIHCINKMVTLHSMECHHQVLKN